MSADIRVEGRNNGKTLVRTWSLVFVKTKDGRLV